MKRRNFLGRLLCLPLVGAVWPSGKKRAKDSASLSPRWVHKYEVTTVEANAVESKAHTSGAITFGSWINAPGTRVDVEAWRRFLSQSAGGQPKVNVHFNELTSTLHYEIDEIEVFGKR